MVYLYLQRIASYSPALTLRGLFLQFLTFFSSTKVEQDTGYVVEIGDYMRTSYLWEDQVVAFLIPGPYPPATPVQNELCRIWDSTCAPETVIAKYSSGPSSPVTRHDSKLIFAHGKNLHRISSVNPRWEQTLKAISQWTCRQCPYGSDQLPHNSLSLTTVQKMDVDGDAEHSLLYQAPSSCQIEKLNDDTLAELASHLSSEGIISLSTAWSRFKLITNAFHVLLHLELRCFFLRTSMLGSNVIMGVGVAMETRPVAFSSDFDWLSQEAFDRFRVRKSIEKRDFQYFLPLAFSPEHFKRSEAEIWSRLAVMEEAYRKQRDQNTRRPPQQNGQRRGMSAPHASLSVKPLDIATVLFKMMNNIVVSLMNSCDEEQTSALAAATTSRRQPERNGRLLHASERALTGYTHLLHTLLSLARSGPRGAALLSSATSHLRNFVVLEEMRNKSKTPDLGELIASLLMVRALPCIDNKGPVTWERVCPSFVEEATVRNVRWVLQQYPYLENIEGEGPDDQARWRGADDARMGMTFNASRTSLRLIMFQVTFMELFVEAYGATGGLKRLDDAYGFVDASLPERMVAEIKEIYKVNTWPAYFSKIRFERGRAFGKVRFAQMLRDTVKESAKRGYHTQTRKGVLDDYKSKKGVLIVSYLKNHK